MRKQQINVLSSLPAEDLRSMKDLKNVCDELTEIQPKLHSEVESNNHIELDYHAYSLEQQRKFSDSAELLFESIPLKKKLSRSKKVVTYNQMSKHVKDMCYIFLNWALNSIRNEKKVQAYSILTILQKMTDKKSPVKFASRKVVRIRINLL